MSRNEWTHALLCIALLALVSALVSAETDVYASGVIRGKYLYNMDDDIDASVADTRVDLDISIGALTLGAVYRAYLLSDEGYNPALVAAPPTEVKHRYAALEHEDLYLRAGHFFATFGHGLTLRSHEEVDLEYDTVLDGLMAEYSFGGVSLAALSGMATDDELGPRHTEHVVRAVRASAPLTEWAEVAGSVVERSRTERDEEVELPDSLARFGDTVAGAGLSVWAGPVSLVAEYAGLDGDNPGTDRDENYQGHATYAAATLDLSWLTLFGEIKDYYHFDHYLVSPPTCVREHLWTLFNRATYEIDLDGEQGFLVEGSAPIGDAFFVTGGASEARSQMGALRHWEMFGQFDWSVGSDATVSAGAARSREYLVAGGDAGGKFTERMTGAATAEFGFAGSQVLELTVEGQQTEEPSGESHNDYILSTAYYPGLDVTLIATMERTTSESESKNSWFMVEARKLLQDDLEVSLAAGTERGGKKCTGGVCYFEPEFEGVRCRFTKFF